MLSVIAQTQSARCMLALQLPNNLGGGGRGGGCMQAIQSKMMLIIHSVLCTKNIHHDYTFVFKNVFSVAVVKALVYLMKASHFARAST